MFFNPKIMVVLITYILLIFPSFSETRHPLDASRYAKLSGQSALLDQQQLWNKKYQLKSYLYGKAPAPFLAENVHFFSEKSKILDIGMGEGRNAAYLAKKGYDVTGIDISSVAIKKSKLLAKEFGTTFKTINASLYEYPFRPNEFDVIICFYFLDRKIINKMLSWLKPGGLLVFEAFTQKQMEVSEHDYRKFRSNYFLKPQELLGLFPNTKILKFEEPLHEKNFRSSIIVKKSQ